MKILLLLTLLVGCAGSGSKDSGAELESGTPAAQVLGDPFNCGSPGQTCSGKLPGCCDGKCVDLTDVGNCGGCGLKCQVASDTSVAAVCGLNSNGVPTCYSSDLKWAAGNCSEPFQTYCGCQCKDGTTRYAVGCSIFDSDPKQLEANCDAKCKGQCLDSKNADIGHSNSCAAYYFEDFRAQCISLNQPSNKPMLPGYKSCGSELRYINSDPNHCGGCSASCPTGHCYRGFCVAPGTCTNDNDCNVSGFPNCVFGHCFETAVLPRPENSSSGRCIIDQNGNHNCNAGLVCLNPVDDIGTCNCSGVSNQRNPTCGDAGWFCGFHDSIGDTGTVCPITQDQSLTCVDNIPKNRDPSGFACSCNSNEDCPEGIACRSPSAGGSSKICSNVGPTEPACEQSILVNGCSCLVGTPPLREPELCKTQYCDPSKNQCAKQPAPSVPGGCSANSPCDICQRWVDLHPQQGPSASLCFQKDVGGVLPVWSQDGISYSPQPSGAASEIGATDNLGFTAAANSDCDGLGDVGCRALVGDLKVTCCRQLHSFPPPANCVDINDPTICGNTNGCYWLANYCLSR